MDRRHFLGTVGALSLTPAWAQSGSFPNRPVRVIVPFAAGNTLDTSMRQVGELFTRSTGQQLLVDNRPGGAGIIAAQAAANATPDGYTLLLGSISMLAINPHTFAKLPYDPEKSFRPVTNFLGTSMVMAVNAQRVPPNTLEEFVAWAKPRGSEVSFASYTAGNSSHFAGELLNKHAGLKMVHVPYNGTPPAVQSLLGGNVDVAILPLLAVKPHVAAGKIKVLAVTSPKRSPLLPDVPTFAELGYPELEIYIWAGIVAPAATPDAAVNKLNAEFVKALNSQEIRDKWSKVDFEPLPTTPEAFGRFERAELKRWGDAVRLSGFKMNQ